MKPIVSLVLRSLATILVLAAFVLIIFLWNSASRLERVLIIMFGFSSGLTEISVMYTLAQTHWFKESDPKVRLERLNNVEKQYRKILLLYIPFCLLMLAIGVWQLFRVKP